MRLVLLSVAWLACSPQSMAKGPVRSCERVILYAPSRSLGTVSIRGEWNAFAAEPMTRRPDGTWEWKRVLEPRASGYGYRFDLGNDELIVDPSTGLTRWVGAIEHSRLLVPDCKAPLLELSSFSATNEGALSLSVRALLGSEGTRLKAPVITLDREASMGRFDPFLGSLSFEATGLAAGKHTVTISVEDEAGRSAERLLLPFWVEAVPFKWGDGLLYFVFTDRFRNGDPANDAPVDGGPTAANYQGGDFRGVTAAIEEGYFDRLGVRVLWLSPPDANPDQSFVGKDGRQYTGYHGYWPAQPRQVAKRFGTLADLRALTRAAHAHGIRVVTDLVLNHVHEQHPYATQHRQDGWFNLANACVCGTNGCDWVEKALVCWFTNYLPDYNWRNTAMADQFIADMLWWVEEADLDGFRLDAVKHLDHVGSRMVRDSLSRITAMTGVHYYLVGETFVGSDGRPLIKQCIGPQQLDGQFDFPLYWPLLQTFARNGSLVPLDEAVRLNESYYSPETINSPFLGNHDVPRFISHAADQIEQNSEAQAWGNRPPPSVAADEPFRRTKWAFTFLLTQPGLPLIYYGDEVGTPGAGDPDNRRFLKSGGLTQQESELLEFVRKIGTARRNNRALQVGVRDTLLIERDVYVFQRTEGASAAIVVINRGPERTVFLNAKRSLQWPATFTEGISGTPVTVPTSGELRIPAQSSMLLLRGS